MPRRTYHDLVGKFSEPHGVVGRIEDLHRIELADDMIINLIAALAPKGDWATGQLQDGSGHAVHCVFELKEDADRVAHAVQAEHIGRYPGFASTREFRLDGEARRAITQVLRELAR